MPRPRRMGPVRLRVVLKLELGVGEGGGGHLVDPELSCTSPRLRSEASNRRASWVMERDTL